MNLEAVACLPKPLNDPAMEFIEPWIRRINAIYFIFSSVISTNNFEDVKNYEISLD